MAKSSRLSVVVIGLCMGTADSTVVDQLIHIYAQDACAR